MYETRQQMRKQMREHRFFYHFILAIGIFVFSQGCSLMPKNASYAATAVILGLIMHNASVGKVFERIFKISFQQNMQVAMIISLLLIAIISYFVNFGFAFFLLLDLAAIILFVSLSIILSKLKNRQE